MATTVIRVPFMPTAPEALAWSAENLIVVGAGETLCILVPRQKGTWDVISRPASFFTVEEIIPMDAGMGSDMWSLGEEQSQRHIVSLAWSPPGIAKFETCALAVLHSNHVLTIWECTGRPHDSTQWNRCLLINHVIQALYRQENGKDLSNGSSERLQVSQRISAFAWASKMRDPGVSMAHPSQTGQLMAVGTGRGDLLVVEIHSPHDLFDFSESEWSVKILHRISASTIGAARQAESHSGQREADVRVSHIAWSDWAVGSKDSSDMYSHLAFIADGVLHTARVRASGKAESYATLDSDIVGALPVPNTFPVTGPLQFLPKTNTAVFFAADAIISVDLETSAVNTHDLDGRWDSITGIAQTTDSEGTNHLHFTSHLSTSSSKTCHLSGDLLTTSPYKPQWRQAVNESISRFNIAHGLGRHVQDIVCGIASSASRDLVAVCVVCEPDSSPAHFITSMEACDVSITRECDLTPDLCSDSAEILLFSMRQQGSEATERLIKHFAAPESSSMLETTTASSANEAAIQRIKKELIDTPLQTRARFERLAGLAGGIRPHPHLPRSDYNHNIKVILDVASNLPQPANGTHSSRMLYSLQVVKSKLAEDSTADLVSQEKCIVCSQDLPFESLFWSRCPSGHQYSRCALTFLSIQEPGQSKRCRLCDAQSLNEYALLKPDKTAGQSDVSDEDFARVLFTACNKCLYCGGKFVA
ncbi:hypothetical protein LTR95_007074 [Oleoguttula sp. CCFEE 5521]